MTEDRLVLAEILEKGNRSVKAPGQAARVRSRGFQFQGSSSAICRAG